MKAWSGKNLVKESVSIMWSIMKEPRWNNKVESLFYRRRAEG